MRAYVQVIAIIAVSAVSPRLHQQVLLSYLKPQHELLQDLLRTVPEWPKHKEPAEPWFLPPQTHAGASHCAAC